VPAGSAPLTNASLQDPPPDPVPTPDSVPPPDPVQVLVDVDPAAGAASMATPSMLAAIAARKIRPTLKPALNMRIPTLPTHRSIENADRDVYLRFRDTAARHTTLGADSGGRKGRLYVSRRWASQAGSLGATPRASRVTTSWWPLGSDHLFSCGSQLPPSPRPGAVLERAVSAGPGLGLAGVTVADGVAWSSCLRSAGRPSSHAGRSSLIAGRRATLAGGNAPRRSGAVSGGIWPSAARRGRRQDARRRPLCGRACG
jgi:hypothetical protein